MARRKKSLKILFVADPLEHFDPVAETSLYMMLEAQRRGHQIFSITIPEISVRGCNLFGEVKKLKVLGKGKRDWYKVLSQTKRELKTFDAILLRKDPPADLQYLHHLYLMELLSGEVYFMNHPSGILMANEKLLSLPYLDRIPETLISAKKEELLDFIRRHPQGTIIKPLEEGGGRGVYYIRSPRSDNIHVILETATNRFSKHVVLQAYQSAVKKGDKRILLLGQDYLGAFLRKPAKGEHRANLHAGGHAVQAKLTRQDQDLIELLRPLLSKMGLDFVGLDLIGDRLIEINVTSPMGIHEVNKTSGTHCERRVLDFIEERVI